MTTCRHRNELAEFKFMLGDMSENFRISFVCLTAKFTLGPVLTTITFRPCDVSLDRIVCSIWIVFSFQKNNIFSYIRLYLSTSSSLYSGSQPTNRTVHLIKLKRIFKLSYTGAAEPGWYPVLLCPCPLQCVTKNSARICILRSSFGVTGIWRKDEITSPQRRRTKVISWERSSVTTGVSRLGDRGNETQFNFDTPFVCAFLDKSELLTGSRIYLLLTNTMAHQRVYIRYVHPFFVLFFICSLTLEARLRPHACPCGFCGGQTGASIDFSSSIWNFSLLYSIFIYSLVYVWRCVILAI